MKAEPGMKRQLMVMSTVLGGCSTTTCLHVRSAAHLGATGRSVKAGSVRCKICDEPSSPGDHACQVTEILTDGFPSPCCTCIPGWPCDWPFQAPTAISQGQKGWGSLQPVARACSGISALPLRQLKLSFSVIRPNCWLTTHGAWGMPANVIAKRFHFLSRSGQFRASMKCCA